MRSPLDVMFEEKEKRAAAARKAKADATRIKLNLALQRHSTIRKADPAESARALLEQLDDAESYIKKIRDTNNIKKVRENACR
jgi:ribosomal protein S11